MSKLTTFRHDDKEHAVSFIETIKVNRFVECDVYEFQDLKDRDLALITVQPHGSTPLQEILLEDSTTVQGYLSGEGGFILNDKKYTSFDVGQEFVVHKGDTMQWKAGDTELHYYEICIPKYKDGRYRNIAEE